MIGHRGHVILLVAMFIISAKSHVGGTLNNQQLTEKMTNITEEFHKLGNKVDNILQLLTSSVTACPDGWTRLQGSCYGVGAEEVNWADAQEICKMFRAQLVEVGSWAENEFLKRTGRTRGYNVIWLGATDVFADGHWLWASSGQSLTFSDWHPAEANLIGDEDCLALYRDPRNGLPTFTWHDVGCGARAYFVCEIRLT